MNADPVADSLVDHRSVLKKVMTSATQIGGRADKMMRLNGEPKKDVWRSGAMRAIRSK
jgi:hypothetical protein